MSKKLRSRRDFLASTMSLGVVAAWPGPKSAAFQFQSEKTKALAGDAREKLKEGLAVDGLKDVTKAEKSLKLLILGGTGFLGPHIVQYADARGHSITLFNRGKTNSHLFGDHEKLVGDRDPDKGEGLKALKGREWDAVIDTSSYYPRITHASCELLKDHVDFYTLVSSISVYKDTAHMGIDEDYPVGMVEDETIEEISGGTYGALKALCEQAAEHIMPGRVANIRPGLIVGPRDYSDRFTYWPVRVERGGEVLAPGLPTDATQWIDARDLARFCVKSVEDQATGRFNAVGPEAPSNIAEILYGCKAVCGSDATFTWVPAEFLAEHAVGPWIQMPVWVPMDGDLKGIMTVNIERALGAGMTCRPLAETVADTLEWWHSLPEKRRNGRMRAGITSEEEAEVLTAWHEK